MISLEGSDGCSLIQRFLVSRYAEMLRDYKGKFVLVLPGNRIAPIFHSGEFMAINLNYIFYDEAACDRIKLSEEERYAFLAHELGHYYDDTSRDLEQQLREINADDFAVKLGLGRYLASALQKIQEAVDEETRMLIQERIDRLRNLGFDDV